MHDGWHVLWTRLDKVSTFTCSHEAIPTNRVGLLIGGSKK